jgi:hypothetical protein
MITVRDVSVESAGRLLVAVAAKRLMLSRWVELAEFCCFHEAERFNPGKICRYTYTEPILVGHVRSLDYVLIVYNNGKFLHHSHPLNLEYLHSEFHNR